MKVQLKRGIKVQNSVDPFKALESYTKSYKGQLISQTVVKLPKSERVKYWDHINAQVSDRGY